MDTQHCLQRYPEKYNDYNGMKNQIQIQLRQTKA